MVKRERHVANENAPSACSISFLVGFIKDLGFRSIFLKCDNKPSTKSPQDAVIQACAGVEMIPQGVPEGDHMDRGSVRIADDRPLPSCPVLQHKS